MLRHTDSTLQIVIEVSVGELQQDTARDREALISTDTPNEQRCSGTHLDFPTPASPISSSLNTWSRLSDAMISRFRKYKSC